MAFFEESSFYLRPLTFFLVSLAIAWLVRGFLLQSLKRWARRTETSVDNLFMEALHGPSGLWVVLFSLHFTLKTSHLPSSFIDYGSKFVSALLILSVSFFLANLLVQFVRPLTQTIHSPLPLTGLAQTILKGAVLMLGGLILLSHLGISITPIITALGIGGLAVALALQDTLANLFSGIHILVEQPIRVGDYIKLTSGEEGYVVDIGWRTTRIRMLPNNMIIIPNQKLAQAIITNYHLPEKRMALLVPIGVSYDCDPDDVEKILVEEAVQGAKEIPGLLPEPAPFVRFIPGFGDFSLNFTLICQVEEFVDQYLAQHELRKRIFKRFRKEGIEIPFPIRTIRLKNEDELNGKRPDKEQAPSPVGPTSHSSVKGSASIRAD